MSDPTVAIYKAMYVIPGTANTDDDDVIQLALDAASLSLDQAYGRSSSFESGVTKEFQARDPRYLDVVDLISVTSVAVDENSNGMYSRTLATTDYRLEPVNAPRYQRISIRPLAQTGWVPGEWIRVIGDWGYVVSDGGSPPVYRAPANVLQARLLLAHRLVRRKDAPFSVLAFPEMGTAVREARSDPDVDALMKEYDRTQFAYIA